jgi:hypothetical protein
MNGAVPNPVPVLRPQVRAANASPRTTNKRFIWDCVIGIAVLIYLSVVLCMNLYSPAFGLILIVLAAYEMLEPHCGKRSG